MSTEKIAAIDGDGVLVDYRQHYANAWFNAFGEKLTVHDPSSWYATRYWGAPHLSGAELQRLRSKGFNHHHWRTMPAMPGAVQAVRQLYNAGWTIVCVTALDEEFATARLANLHHLGMPIAKVIATGSGSSPLQSPKASALQLLRPDLFVDDYAAYFQGLPNLPRMHKVLIDPQTFSDSPNARILSQQPQLVDATAPSLSHLISSLLS
mgnify:CR=1 FL=1